jgi:predicted phosphodiesterase
MGYNVVRASYSVVDIDRAVLVSDVHCNPGNCRAKEVAKLAAREGASLVVLGDLFDDFHWRVSESELERALRAVFRGVAGLEVHYVTSGSSHDPILERDAHFKLEGLAVHVYPRALVARIGPLRAFLTHGDMALRNGAHAFLVNAIALTFGERLYLEKALKRKLHLPDSWWLIMGHTHIPGIDYEARVANTGSWKAAWWAGLPYWRPPSNTYILAEGRDPELFSTRARG